MKKVPITEGHYEMFVDLLNKGYTIQEIANEKNCPIYYIVHVLISGKNDYIFKKLEEYYKGFQIKEDRCLVIADTHIGYKAKCGNNEKSIYNAYNYAVRNNIKNVLHLGDLLEGKSNKSADSLEIYEQIELLTNIYNSINEVKTYLLFGNHDYNLTCWDYDKVDLIKVISELKNMELIGVQYSYLLFGENLITTAHPCKELYYDWNINLNSLFTISGHHHRYNFVDFPYDIWAPALSIEHAYLSNPGFLELINDDNNVLFRYLDTLGNKIEKQKILKRK